MSVSNVRSCIAACLVERSMKLGAETNAGRFVLTVLFFGLLQLSQLSHLGFEYIGTCVKKIVEELVSVLLVHVVEGV